MAAIKLLKRAYASKNVLNKVGEKAIKMAEIEREKGYRKDVQDINRDIGKYFDVQYSPTSEVKREIRVRYHLNSGPTAPHLVLSDLRTYLYNFLFAKTADHLHQGELYLSTYNPSCETSLASLDLLSSRI